MTTQPSIIVGSGNRGALPPDVATKVAELAQQWANDPSSAPQGDAAVLAALADPSVGVVFDDNITKVTLHPYEADTVRMILPRPGQIERVLQSFDDQTTRDDYALPAPFQEINAILQLRSPTRDELIEFYKFRLGDYILQHCM